jgi:hypothetical protein
VGVLVAANAEQVPVLQRLVQKLEHNQVRYGLSCALRL